MNHAPCVLTAEQAGLAPAAVATVVDDHGSMRRIAAELAGVDRLAVVGRRFSFAAALETALKPQGQATTFLIGTGTDGVDAPWPASGTATECLSATVRGQQLALALCLERGIDPDQRPG
jgi:glutamine---fructose-6-phosphate transaminase (isomerizing)